MDGQARAYALGNALTLMTALGAAGTLDELATAVARELPRALGVHHAELALRGLPGGLAPVAGPATAARPGPLPATRGCLTPIPQVLFTEATRRGQSLVVGLPPCSCPRSLDDGEPTRTTSRMAVLVPVDGPDGAVGALGATFTHGLASAEDLQILGALAAMCGSAVQRLRNIGASDLADVALYRSLAPATLPDLPGLQLAAQYRSAEHGIDVGGDFFEVLPLPGGRVALTIGDVAGHGREAAAAMHLIRWTLHAYAVEGHPPNDVLRRTNAILVALPEQVFATCCYGELDLTTGALRVVTAGHLPPLLLPRSGRPELLELSPGVPLGVVEHPEYAETRVALSPGDALVLYTDGLVESRTVCVVDGLTRLRAASRRASRLDPASLVQHLLSTVRPDSSQDDVAVLAVRYDGEAAAAQGR